MAWSEDFSIWFNLNTPGSVLVSFDGSPDGMVGIENAPGVLATISDQLAGVQQTDRVVLIRSDQKGALAPGSPMTVGGSPRTVRYLLPEPDSDGACTVVWLR